MEYWMILILLIIFSIILGLVQWICCQSRHVAVKLIPVYPFALAWLLCLALGLGAFGKFDAGFLGNGHSLFAIIFALNIGIAASGVLIAWIVYGLTCAYKRSRK